jgi:hypothetical protein
MTAKAIPFTDKTIQTRPTTSLPSLFLTRPQACTRLRDFFSSHLQNPATRRVYRDAVWQFFVFFAEHGIVDLAQAVVGAGNRFFQSTDLVPS